MLKVIAKLAFASSRKHIIKEFEESGVSHHSLRAETLGILINYCEENKIPYQLIARPGMGYSLTRTEVISETKEERAKREKFIFDSFGGEAFLSDESKAVLRRAMD